MYGETVFGGHYPLVSIGTTNKQYSYTNPYKEIFGINFPTKYDPTFNIKKEIEEKIKPKMDYIFE